MKPAVFTDTVKASLEALAAESQRVEPSLEDVGDDFQLIQACGQVRRTIACEEARASALESLIDCLENHDGRLTPFETRMLVQNAKRLDIVLPHRRLGVGLEGYSEGRYAAVKGLALESFKETFQKVIQHLIMLFQKLVELIKKVFNRQKQQQETLLQYYKNYKSGKIPAKTDSDELVEGACRALSVQGKFDPTRIFTNQRKVVEGLSDPSYHNGLIAFSKKVLGVVEKLMANPQEWRSVTSEVNTLEVPIPKGFIQRSVAGATAKYESEPLTMGACIGFQTVHGGNTHGAKGAREILASIGQIGEVDDFSEWKPTEHYMDDLKALGRAGVAAHTDDIERLLKDSGELIRLNTFSTGQLDEAKSVLARVAKQSKDIDPQVGDLVRGLALASEKLSALSVELSRRINESIFKAAQMYVHVLHAPIV